MLAAIGRGCKNKVYPGRCAATAVVANVPRCATAVRLRLPYQRAAYVGYFDHGIRSKAAYAHQPRKVRCYRVRKDLYRIENSCALGSIGTERYHAMIGAKEHLACLAVYSNARNVVRRQ